MRLINGGFGHDGPGGGASTQFWDQRADTHEQQETMPIQDANEHGFSGQNGAPDFDDLIEFAALTAPKLTIQGGTTEILRGIIAREMGMR